MPTIVRRTALLLLGFAITVALSGQPTALANSAPADVAAQVGVGDVLFGANFVPSQEPWMTLAWNAGVRTARIQINWQDIERSRGSYNFDFVDPQLQPLINRGFTIHAILTLPPDWARANNSGIMPANINLAWDHPDNLWARWVEQVAAHYRGRIASYEVWNEPDLDIYWNGSPGEYFQLLRGAYPAIKTNDPNATVVMAGMAIFAERDFLPEVVRTATTHPAGPANNFFFDAVSIHLYSDSALLHAELDGVRGMLDSFGLASKPIWLTETNAPLCCEGGGPPTTENGFATQEEAGWFILQAFANALAVDAERLMVYRLHDADQQPPYGMLRNDESQRPAYTAFRTAATYLSRADDVERTVVNGATIVRFTNADGARVTVAWANSNRQAVIAPEANNLNATLVDWQGNASVIQSEDGVYHLALAPATNAQIGGPPQLIVEQGDDIPPTIFVSPLPDSQLEGSVLDLSWSGTDNQGGTGLASYDVQVSHNGGPWLIWLQSTQSTSATYDVSAGGNFAFRVRARDGAGNVSGFERPNLLGTETPGVGALGGAASNFTSLPDIGAGDLFYGANFVPPEEPWVSLAWEAGVRTSRIQINWQDVEQTPNIYSWSKVDSEVLPLLNFGYEINAILTLPPDYRRADPEGGLMPANLHLDWDDEQNWWGKWVFRVADRYKGQIASYEIWNEPDVNRFWNGSAEDYTHLLRIAYQAIKTADPDATVVMAGMALRDDLSFLPEALDILAADEDAAANNHYFDAAAIHVYSDTNLIYRELIETRELLESYGLGDKPVWLTETNVPVWGEANGPQAWQSGYADPQEAGWFMMQAIATSLAADAERLMVYRLHDVGEPVAYGLLRNDRSERPGYTAYQTAAAFLSDIVAAEREVTPRASIIRFEKVSGGLVTVMWANTGLGAEVTVEASTDAALFANADGAVWPAAPGEDGTYTIKLDPATNRDLARNDAFFFGGPPILLIEDDFTPPNATFDPIPAVGEERIINLSWFGDDGPQGTGVVSYDVQVRRGDGAWEAWLEDTTLIEASFEADEGGAYAFRVRARDTAGNLSIFVENSGGPVYVSGIVAAQVVNLRGEGVSDAVVTLADGRTFTTGAGGFVRITGLEEGVTTFQQVDGGRQGHLTPPPVSTTIGKETVVTWVLTPKDNQVFNGNFNNGLSGWELIPTVENDVRTIDFGDGPVLQLAGQRRPWGSPAIGTTLQLARTARASVLAFRYQIPTEGQLLIVTVASERTVFRPASVATLWKSPGSTDRWQRVWLDISDYQGQPVELIFSLEGSKGTMPGLVRLDDIAVGGLPNSEQ